MEKGELKELAQQFIVENVMVDTLKPHPKNYRRHTAEQVEGLIERLKQHGWYKNVVVSSDGYILAGHGMVEAIRAMGLKEVPIYRFSKPHDDQLSLHLMVGDNEISRQAVDDTDELMELLNGLKMDGLLLGTGYDEHTMQVLAGDLGDAIPNIDGYENPDSALRIIIEFQTEEELQATLIKLGLPNENRVRFKSDEITV